MAYTVSSLKTLTKQCIGKTLCELEDKYCLGKRIEDATKRLHALLAIHYVLCETYYQTTSDDLECLTAMYFKYCKSCD